MAIKVLKQSTEKGDKDRDDAGEAQIMHQLDNPYMRAAHRGLPGPGPLMLVMRRWPAVGLAPCTSSQSGRVSPWAGGRLGLGAEPVHPRGVLHTHFSRS